MLSFTQFAGLYEAYGKYVETMRGVEMPKAPEKTVEQGTGNPLVPPANPEYLLPARGYLYPPAGLMPTEPTPPPPATQIPGQQPQAAPGISPELITTITNLTNAVNKLSVPTPSLDTPAQSPQTLDDVIAKIF